MWPCKTQKDWLDPVAIRHKIFERKILFLQDSAIEKKDKCVKFIQSGNKSYFCSTNLLPCEKLSSVTNYISKTFLNECLLMRLYGIFLKYCIHQKRCMLEWDKITFQKRPFVIFVANEMLQCIKHDDIFFFESILSCDKF